MDKKYILAIDQGTTSSRAILFDKLGKKVAVSQKEFPQYYPKPGWVEHNALEIWNSVQSVLAEIFINSDIQPSQVAGIGITNQRETTVVWDKHTGLPIHNAIVWQSRQTADLAEQLRKDGYEEFFHKKTGLVIDAYFSATKVRWLLDQVKDAQLRAEKGDLLFGTIDSWLTWKLTNGEVFATDVTNASRTMLFNIEELQWDDEILSLLNIPKIMLPNVHSNSEIYGQTKAFHFFGQQVPIAGMIGDQQGALVGHLALSKGMVKNTYGTGSFIIMNTGDQLRFSENKLLTTIGFQIGEQLSYALEGSIFIAGSVIQWLRDGLEIIQDSKETQTMAQQSTNQDEIYLVPAFTGLGAPYWDSDARGSMFGITRGTTKNDIAKAALQSIAYQSKDVLETMIKDTGIAIPSLQVDGGATANEYLMQFQADIMNVPIKRPDMAETTAFGAAMLAGLAVGFWESIAEIAALHTQMKEFTPLMDETKIEELYSGWKKAVAATQLFKK